MRRYSPLIVVFLISIISGFVLVHRGPEPWTHYWMINFSGMFFVFLATLKFWDLKGFSVGFRKYDLVAKKVPFYGFCYPFLELLIGLAFLSHFAIVVAAIITVILMVINFLGVITALFKGESLQCACMGTKLDLPLSVVSLVEVFAMGAMAVLILLKVTF